MLLFWAKKIVFSLSNKDFIHYNLVGLIIWERFSHTFYPVSNPLINFRSLFLCMYVRFYVCVCVFFTICVQRSVWNSDTHDTSVTCEFVNSFPSFPRSAHILFRDSREKKQSKVTRLTYDWSDRWSWYDLLGVGRRVRCNYYVSLSFSPFCYACIRFDNYCNGAWCAFRRVSFYYKMLHCGFSESET